MNNRLILSVLSVLTALVSHSTVAQSFRYRAEVAAVGQSGYHRIQLSPDVIGRLNENLTDIRLYDGQQREVPYLLTRESPTPASGFVAYPVITRTMVPRVATTLVVRNPAKQPISTLNLLIKNTNVSKKARLSGSSDGRNWYGIDDDVWLAPTNNEQGTAGIRQLNFPRSDYEYYRLAINDSLTTPLNVLQVGYYANKMGMGRYDWIPGVVVTQRDSSDHRTYLRLQRNAPARISKLYFIVRAPAQFHRRAELGHFVHLRQKRGRTGLAFETIQPVNLSSADSNVVYLNDVSVKDLYLIVDNQDSPPLAFGAVRAEQITTYLTANLTAGSPYELRYSADNVGAPAYDLTYFKASLPANPPIIRANPLTTDQADQSVTSSLLNSRGLMWIVLGVVLILLGVFSYRMLHEVGQRKE